MFFHSLGVIKTVNFWLWRCVRWQLGHLNWMQKIWTELKRILNLEVHSQLGFPASSCLDILSKMRNSGERHSMLIKLNERRKTGDKWSQNSSSREFQYQLLRGSDAFPPSSHMFLPRFSHFPLLCFHRQDMKQLVFPLIKKNLEPLASISRTACGHVFYFWVGNLHPTTRPPCLIPSLKFRR